ncbi:MAG TPA: CPBP family intramembrane glutamic endopeptidase [Acidimicrobiales bacterium]|jgi:membrane protease YdiL (CAAX protease family)|nr:CPBP family intramembrane glutamic endopeptidase [Acidimicrobiales bacterium]
MSMPYPAAGSSTARAQAEPTWGLPDALVGWAAAFVFANVAGAVVLLAGGYQTREEIESAPLAWTMVSSLPIWIAFVAIAVFVAHTKGNGWIRDFHVSLKAIDVPVGIVAGVVAQFVLVPLISFPILKLTGEDADDLSRSAQDLADKVHGAGGALLFLLVVGVVAPIAEELFFRGLLFRAIEKRWNQWWALGLSSAFFGLTHFQPLQFVALTAAGAVFGILVVRTGRLGPAIVAHMAFNISTVVVLLWLS